jgi:hypothetical protein
VNGIARAGLWAAVSGALLFGVWYALCAWLTRGMLPGVGDEFFRVISLQALAPLWLATLASALVLARVFPGLERGARGLITGVACAAMFWFFPVGIWLFAAWSPGGVGDWLRTWLLLVAAVGAALLLPRWFVPALAPGAFAPGRVRGNVAV